MALLINSSRLWILIVIRYLRRHARRLGIIPGISVLIVFLQLEFNFFGDEDIIRIGIVGTYQEHDIPLEATRLLSNSLVDADSNGKIKPSMVKGWETSQDATLFKFKLKEDLKWADNTPVRAGDISINIPDVAVNTTDEYNLQLKLKESYSPLPSILTKPIFKKGSNLLGTGPYRITKIEKSKIFITKLTLEANEKKLPKAVIRFYPNEKVAQTGFNMGEVQVLLGVTNFGFATQNPKASILTKTDYNKIVTIIYSTKDQLLSNRSLRQALSYQAPQIERYEVSGNPFPKNSWVYDETAKKYLNNPEEAKAAVERAKSVLEKEKLKEELTITTTPNLEDVANEVVDSWRKLGFNVKIRLESGIPQNFQILLITQSIPADPDQYFLWHSTQEKTNLSKYSSARVDKDLEDGRKTADEEERKNKYFDFQRTLLEDAPATFLYFPKYSIVYLKKVEGSLNKLLPLQFPN